MFNPNLFINAINLLAKEKKISKTIIKEAIEEALIKTYTKQFDPESNLKVVFDMSKGNLKLLKLRMIVEEVKDSLNEISLDDSKKINSKNKIGDFVEEEIKFTKEFGFLTTQHVKQIIKQKINERQKEEILKDYKEKIGTLIRGTVENIKDTFYIIAFGKTYGFLNKKELVNKKYYKIGDKVEAVIIKIEENPKGVPIILSQKSPLVVECILKDLIPEIKNNEIIIKRIARFAGVRTKLIVSSNVPGLDPVGTIIGERGSRIKEVIEKVGREFIDVIPEINDIQKQIERAMVPAEVKYVHIEDGKVTVVVDEENFGVAIGKNGSNAKVVAKLLDIDISIKKISDIDFKIPKKNTYGPMKEYDYNALDNNYNNLAAYDEFSNEDDVYEKLNDDNVHLNKRLKNKKKKPHKQKLNNNPIQQKKENKINDYNYDYDNEFEDDINYDQYDAYEDDE